MTAGKKIENSKNLELFNYYFGDEIKPIEQVLNISTDIIKFEAFKGTNIALKKLEIYFDVLKKEFVPESENFQIISALVMKLKLLQTAIDLFIEKKGKEEYSEEIVKKLNSIKKDYSGIISVLSEYINPQK